MTTTADANIVDIVLPDAPPLRAVIGCTRQSEDNHRLARAQGTVLASRDALSVLERYQSIISCR